MRDALQYSSGGESSEDELFKRQLLGLTTRKSACRESDGIVTTERDFGAAPSTNGQGNQWVNDDEKQNSAVILEGRRDGQQRRNERGTEGESSGHASARTNVRGL